MLGLMWQTLRVHRGLDSNTMKRRKKHAANVILIYPNLLNARYFIIFLVQCNVEKVPFLKTIVKWVANWIHKIMMKYTRNCLQRFFLALLLDFFYSKTIRHCNLVCYECVIISRKPTVTIIIIFLYVYACSCFVLHSRRIGFCSVF